ncbi:hypothetical protein BG011_004145 [Mortierella polycephala]|uniref:Uncharacterized protein n=1 Tax=Mortierella polycephala TaxID=41804 RepID=A0A9P6Q1T9_9FUNG|nr:hypothetical protein BG011_004145 [Mortierella polycephala]
MQQQQQQPPPPQQQVTPGPQTPQDSSQIKTIQSPMPHNSIPNGVHGQAESLAGGHAVTQGQDANRHTSSPTSQAMRDRMNAMQSPNSGNNPATPMAAGSPTNRARMTQFQFQAQQQEAQKKQQAMMWNRQQGLIPPDGSKQQLQRQASMMNHQQMLSDARHHGEEYVGSPSAASQTIVQGAIISPVSSGIENMTMNSGGVDEIGRIQSLLTDDGGIENDGLQMDDMGMDAYGNINLSSLSRSEERQMQSGHDSMLQLFGSLSGHTQKVSTCTFSYDGRWLASAGVDKKLLIWSVPDKELKCTIEGSECHAGVRTNARFNSDERLILGTTSLDYTVRIWDLTPLAQGTSSSAKAVQILKGHKITVTSVDFCPSVGSNHCVSCDGDGELRLWDFMTGQCERVIKLLLKPGYSSNPVRYHPHIPNLVAVAVGTTIYTVQINDPKSQPRPINTTHDKNITTLDWSSHGNLLVSASEELICVWDTTHATQWKVLSTQQSQKISSCAFLKSHNAAGSTTAGTVSNSSTSAAATTRLVYSTYEKIFVWTFSVNGYMRKTSLVDVQAHPGKAVIALTCCKTSLDGENELLLASASAGNDGNLKLWRIAG